MVIKLDFIHTENVDGIVVSTEPLYIIDTSGELTYIDNSESISYLSKESSVYDSLLVLADFYFEYSNLEDEISKLNIKKNILDKKIKNEIQFLGTKL